MRQANQDQVLGRSVENAGLPPDWTGILQWNEEQTSDLTCLTSILHYTSSGLHISAFTTFSVLFLDTKCQKRDPRRLRNHQIWLNKKLFQHHSHFQQLSLDLWLPGCPRFTFILFSGDHSLQTCLEQHYVVPHLGCKSPRRLTLAPCHIRVISGCRFISCAVNSSHLKY